MKIYMLVLVLLKLISLKKSNKNQFQPAEEEIEM